MDKPTTRDVAEMLERELGTCIGVEGEMDDTRADFEGEQSVWIRNTPGKFEAEGWLEPALLKRVKAALGAEYPELVDTSGLKKAL